MWALFKTFHITERVGFTAQQGTLRVEGSVWNCATPDPMLTESSLLYFDASQPYLPASSLAWVQCQSKNWISLDFFCPSTRRITYKARRMPLTPWSSMETTNALIAVGYFSRFAICTPSWGTNCASPSG